MKASARKSVLKSALDVVRSRRSGASRANLKGTVDVRAFFKSYGILHLVAPREYFNTLSFVPVLSRQFLGRHREVWTGQTSNGRRR